MITVASRARAATLSTPAAPCPLPPSQRLARQGPRPPLHKAPERRSPHPPLGAGALARRARGGGLMDTTSDVRIWRTDVYKGSRGNTHYVRWGGGEKRFEELFKTAALAESFHSRLISAARSGEAFSVRTGLPVSMHRDDADSSWYAFACGEHHPAQTRCAVQRHGVRRGEEDPGVESTPVRRAQAEPRHAGTGGPASRGQPGPGATPPGRRRQAGRQRPRAGRVLRLSLLLCAAAGRGRRSHGERTGDPAGGVGGAVPARVGAQGPARHGATAVAVATGGGSSTGRRSRLVPCPVRRRRRSCGPSARVRHEQSGPAVPRHT
jgi:hypothetical protein